MSENRARPASPEEIKAMGGHHEIVRSEPVSFATKDGRIYPKGTPEYDALLAEAQASLRGPSGGSEA